MTIDWSTFTPWSAALGGVVIGLAVAWFVLVSGRVAGISGIVSGLLKPRAGDLSWRLAFVAAMLLGMGAFELIERSRARNDSKTANATGTGP